MNYFIYDVFLLVLIMSIKCDEKMPCRKGNHFFGIILYPKLNHSVLKGLDKYTYTFYLISSYETINDYQIAFRATFPVNINFSLNNRIAYQFNPDVFCLNFLIKGKIETLKGNLLQYDSQDIVISGIWIKIEEIIINRPIEKNKPHSNCYYIMTNVYLSKLPSEIVLMKKLNNKDESFYQLLIAEIDLIDKRKDNSDSNSNNEDYLKIGTETEINLIDGSKTVGMVNDKEYSAILTLGIDIHYYRLTKINNMICLDETSLATKCSFIS